MIKPMTLEKVRVWLRGKKTYLVALSAIVASVIAYTNNSIDAKDMWQQVVGLILTMTVRAGIANKPSTPTAQK
jgi:hypothetical protein